MLAKDAVWKDLIAEDVTLVDPLAQVEGKASFIGINEPFFSMIIDSRQHRIIEKDNFVITQIETDVITPSKKTITLEVCEWYEIQGNVIQSLRATELITNHYLLIASFASFFPMPPPFPATTSYHLHIQNPLVFL